MALIVVVLACGYQHGGPHPTGNGILLLAGGKFQNEVLRNFRQTELSNVHVETVHFKKGLQGPLPDRNVAVPGSQAIRQPIDALVYHIPQVVLVVQHHVVMSQQPPEHRLVHDAGIGMVGHVQESVASIHGHVNVRDNPSGCIPIIASALEDGRYLPTVTFRIDRRAAPVTPGQCRLHQSLQVGLNLQHLPDEDNQFRLAELLQVHIRFLHRAKGIGLVQPGQQQCPDMLATSTDARRTGTIGLLDTFGTVGNPQAVRLRPGSLTPVLEGAARRWGHLQGNCDRVENSVGLPSLIWPLRSLPGEDCL